MIAVLGATVLAGALAFGEACAQSPAPSAPAAPAVPDAKPADAGALAPLAWLEGCWRGTVGPREFREHWMAPRGGMMLGVSQTVADGKTVGYEYLRLDSRADGIFYVAVPSGQKETAFRLAEQTVDRAGDRNDEIFGFANPAHDFPQKITYRRATLGWLYAVVEGKVGGADRQLTYPMRRVDCETGELVER